MTYPTDFSVRITVEQATSNAASSDNQTQVIVADFNRPKESSGRATVRCAKAPGL